ncbi:Mitogen-activated protein kinase pmk-2 [Parelaphostrongylus tenuis]|uniref:mitogen-activated protein kinase n=1 Tax=Parelaphostrongylus tenuis TaxID=148309 RepID=A0AAD5QLU6_PARTN|nr:Mitogen-activated protein kinase pmk-2 [Parelaphostrongylus tenuis]
MNGPVRRPVASAEPGVFFANIGPPPPERPPPIGFHEVELNKTRWVIPKAYDRLRCLGEGAYGVVCTAEDLRTGQRVAVKKFFRPFQSTIHAKRTYRELKLLRTLKHGNVLEMIDVFTPDPDVTTLNNVYFVSVLIGSDLQNILKIQRLKNEQIQALIYQVLRGLKYIHSAGIVHRDLKPSNIAVNEFGDVKILDFGLARTTDHEMTGYVSTRWYRAPEIMLNWMHYTQTVDVWSVGCILAELVSGKPMFPGDDHIDQLTRIMGVVGTPSYDFLSKIQSEEARNYIRNLPWMPRVDFFTLLPDASADAVDLLGRMLVLDPDDRISVIEALDHSYVQDCRDPGGEPVADHQVGVDAEEEAATLLDDWRELIWKEIQNFHLCPRAVNCLNDDLTRQMSEVERQSPQLLSNEDVDDEGVVEKIIC